MGTRLILVLGCWVLGPCGASRPSSHPRLEPLNGLWVPAGAVLRLRCSGPGPLFGLYRDGSGPVLTIASRRGSAIFNRLVTDSGLHTYTCRCRDPPDPPVGPPRPPGPSSNPLEVAVTDPSLDPPKLSLQPLQPLPAPRGTNVSVICEGPPGAATFRLYRGGPGEVVGERWVAGGGTVPFSLGPFRPRDEGAYVCTYSPDGGGVSELSPKLLLLVEEGTAIPENPNWWGCEYWEGSH